MKYQELNCENNSIVVKTIHVVWSE